MFLLCVSVLTQSYIDSIVSRSLSVSCMKCVSFFEIANAPISVVWPGHLRNQPSKTYRNHKTNAYPVPRNMCQRETIEKCTRTENWHIQKHIDKFHRFDGNSTTKHGMSLCEERNEQIFTNHLNRRLIVLMLSNARMLFH